MTPSTRTSTTAPGVLARADALLTRLATVLAILGMLVLVVAIAVVVGDIIWRRVGGGSFIGAVDLTQLSVMVAVSFAIPYAFATGGHVTVDLLGGALSAAGRRVLDVLALLVGTGLMGFLCGLSARRGLEVWAYGDVSQDLAVPMGLYWGALVAGLGLSCLVCLVRAGALIRTPVA